jgi:hypothetical protein
MPTTKPLILLVDDFDDALEIYSTYLSFHGYQVMTGATARRRWPPHGSTCRPSS